MRESLINGIINKKQQTQGSGWNIEGVVRFEVKSFLVAVPMGSTTYGTYCDYPTNLNGIDSIINFQSNGDCVRTAMLIHFEKENFKKARRHLAKQSVLKSAANKKFDFPADINVPIALEDFDRLEKLTNTNFWIYQVKRKRCKGRYKLRLTRVGNNPNVPPDRYIYLCQINDENHVALIDDVQNFIRSARLGNYTRYARFCTVYFQIVGRDYERHYQQCVNFEGCQNVVLPNPDKTYKFTAIDAPSKAPFVAYYYTEGKLIPTDEITNSVHKHEIISYMYCILDHEGMTRAVKIQTGGANLGEDMIKNLFDDYKKLFREFSPTLFRKPVLTSEDSQKYKATNNCDQCHHLFDQKDHKRMRHHDWKVEPVINVGRIVKGNFIGALCLRCNIQVTEKRQTLPCIAHNSSNYDVRFILDGNTNEHTTSILSKTGDSYIKVDVNQKYLNNDKKLFRLRFMDSLNFLNGGSIH